ncbi:MAG: acyl-CoA dehydrogenase, partial [Saprospiraceae bacterium]
LQYITQRFIQRKEDEMQEIEAMAAGIKAYTTWNTTAALQECRECLGGKGYLVENRMFDLKNDTDIYTTFEGDNTVLLQLVAKSRLTEFKQSFHNINFIGIINYIAGQAVTNIIQKNPLAVRNTNEDHLLDQEFHLAAFKYREQDLLSSSAKRLKKLIEEGMDSFDAFNVGQHHLIQAAQAYIDRVILSQFYLAVEKIKDPGCKNVLVKLLQLFALHTIENYNGWYLESGYMEGVKTKAIRKMVNQLCWNIRQDAVPLVNAFDIPNNCLGEINQV